MKRAGTENTDIHTDTNTDNEDILHEEGSLGNVPVPITKAGKPSQKIAITFLFARYFVILFGLLVIL